MDDKEAKQYEKDEAAAEKSNNYLIGEFGKWLKSKSLKPATIGKHVGNVEFYANYYLLRYEIIPVDKGAMEIGEFLGDFFIRKASWSSASAVKENISSFKKFYTFLNEIKMLSTPDLNEMKQLIKDDKEDWIESAESYWDDMGEW